MKHRAPIVGDPQAGPGLNDIALKVVGRVAKRNPLVAAFFDEYQPEIAGVLKERLGNQHVDLQKVHEVGTRAARIAMRMQQAKAGESKA